MLIITAAFPDGNKQNFGSPEDLHKYMTEEGYREAKVKAQYVFDTIAGAKMTLDDVGRWIRMGIGQEKGRECGDGDSGSTGGV